ncbi:ribose-phosphate pyrophosphokinase [Candidatus Woesearchaeota archaeon]|nr:ribose-phosphate pyrophosphokinase [Candidatus Woesearchaeota archaeon]
MFDFMEDVILLSDPKSKAWDFSEKIHKSIYDEKEVKISLKEVSIKLFRNGEIDMHVPSNIRNKDVYFIQDSSKNPQQWWVELLLLKDLALSASANSISWVLPNMLYSRKDRKDQPHVPISARALAASLAPYPKRIITMDLHAAQIQGFYPASVPVENLYSFPSAVNYLRSHNSIKNLEKLVIVSPDAGGTVRAESFARRLKSEYPIAFIDKRRVNGEVKEMRLAGDVTNKDVLIVDDMIDSGGTLIEGANLLKENKANTLYCYGCHGLFTKGVNELKTYFDKIFTSNTHYKEGNDVEVIDVSPVFGDAVYRTHKGMSISKLF